MKSQLTYTAASIRKLLRAKKTVRVADWKYRKGVYTARWFIVRDVHWRSTKPGQGAGWLECKVEIKAPRWIMVLVDTDLKIEGKGKD